jgi:predicted RNA-binding Zn-ribbon protein involved in translation (DUF1610 family)
MENIVKPVCKCDSNFDEIFMSGGMRIMGMTNKDIVPSPCYHCETVIETNLHNKRYRCPKCRRKVDPYVNIKNIESKEFFKSFGLDHDYELEENKYMCPKCLKEELTFGLWSFWT